MIENHKYKQGSTADYYMQYQQTTIKK